jgi:hypothetical protein
MLLFVVAGVVSCSPGLAAEAVLLFSACLFKTLALTLCDWFHIDPSPAPWLDDVFMSLMMMLFADSVVITGLCFGFWLVDASKGRTCL